MTLSNGFNCSTQTTYSNYAVNPSYRLGLVQVYSIDIQRSLPQGIVLNIGYNGAHGGNLDMVRAPNRNASGVLNPENGLFNYEDSIGFSNLNALAINARKRLQKGISLQVTYTYAHSIDDASSIGGSASRVAQDDQDLEAEKSNSSFDVRQKVTGNWILELPFGPNRAFLNKGGVWSKIMDGYSVSGDFTFATGTFATPQFGGTAAEIAAGSGNSLRPNLVPGKMERTNIFSGSRSQERKQWFDTTAYCRIASAGCPAGGGPSGLDGLVRVNSLDGPGYKDVDAALFRDFSIYERVKFQFRGEATNVFNFVNLGNPGAVLNSPSTFGVISAQTTTPQGSGMRVIQLGGRILF